MSRMSPGTCGGLAAWAALLWASGVCGLFLEHEVNYRPFHLHARFIEPAWPANLLLQRIALQVSRLTRLRCGGLSDKEEEGEQEDQNGRAGHSGPGQGLAEQGAVGVVAFRRRMLGICICHHLHHSSPRRMLPSLDKAPLGAATLPT